MPLTVIRRAATVGIVIALCWGSSWSPAFAGVSLTSDDLQQEFHEDVRSCVAGTIGTTVEAGEDKAKEFVIDHYLPAADRQVVKSSLKIVDSGNGALTLTASLAGTDGSDSGQVVRAGFSVGDYIMSLLSTYGPPPVAKAADVERWMMPCLQAAFILDGQAGSAVGQAMHDAVFPPNVAPVSTFPASRIPDVGPIQLPDSGGSTPMTVGGN